jgi:geranylgeranyl diphosphate synthase, type I
MDFEADVRQMRAAVEVELKETIDLVGENQYAQLRSMLAYHLGWEGQGAGVEAQGKRIRPLLTLLSAAALGGDWTKALPAAVAVELLHNFSLIHDDIQDHSSARRGRPTVWVKWGMPQAINAGDLMFTLAYQALLKLKPVEVALAATQTLSQACICLTEGQFLDLSYETSKDLPLESYWLMIGGKTAALLAACCELGALAAQASPSQCQAMHNFGFALGLAFQVEDDWLGAWGEPALTGKSVESDLVSGKKTLPVVYALSLNRAFARRWHSGPVTPPEVPGLSALLANEGADEYTRSEAHRLTGEALLAIEAAGCSMEGEQYLKDFTSQLLQRRK